MEMMLLGFVGTHLVLVHAELDWKKCASTVIGMREEKYLGLTSEKKTPELYMVLCFNYIYDHGNKQDTSCFIYFMYFDRSELP